MGPPVEAPEKLARIWLDGKLESATTSATTDMPAYDYQCPACGKVSEKRHGMKEKPAARCPDCGKKAVRHFTAPGLILPPGHTPGSHCAKRKSDSCSSKSTGPTCCGQSEPCAK